MYTRCPKCLTWFSVTEEQLGAARGRVRCGQCLVSFDAGSRLWSEPDEASAPAHWGEVVEPWDPGRSAGGGAGPDLEPGPVPGLPDLPHVIGPSEGFGGEAEPFDPLARISLRATPPDRPPPPFIGVEEVETDLEFGLDVEPNGPRIGDVRRLSTQAKAEGPSFDRMHDRRASGRRRSQQREILTRIEDLEARQRRRWPALSCAGLALLLVVQYAWFMAADLATAFPALTPAIGGFCEATGCRANLPASRHDIRVVSRAVRPHPEYATALTISATLENPADAARPLPAIRFVLYGQDGRPIASRTFEPVEYLEGGSAPPGGIGPGGRVDVGFDLVTPAEAAVSFELRPV